MRKDSRCESKKTANKMIKPRIGSTQNGSIVVRLRAFAIIDNKSTPSKTSYRFHKKLCLLNH